MLIRITVTLVSTCATLFASFRPPGPGGEPGLDLGPAHVLRSGSFGENVPPWTAFPGAPGPLGAPSPAQETIEDAIVAEHNLARQDPAAYAEHLAELRSRFDGNLIRFPGEPSVITREGVAAVDEAIAYLRAAPGRPALVASKGMSRAASDHVRDQGPRGATGHDGSDGSKPWDRVGRYGAWDVVVGENLSYGPDQARRVVMGLIIDDGVSDRGHRHNIFSDEFRYIGVACGPHRVFGIMCAVDYAGRFREE